ncbi:DUF5994 family protein [Mycobacterium paraterrae]|uniref:DUF5994 family protein n=1 Tax=Mycobacterium paraterrae TaxID=577492 RepID=A0ABY3VKW9_9MYCO|nr:DUF5994 family protein [Mycobacterium paraterrae]UMB68810.1 DUF5994 family protein [Mycobacterium paraterrae]
MTLRNTQRSNAAKPRLRLKPKAPTTGYVDGAWWPHSDDLVVELPDLLAVLSIRIGPIERVVYNLGEWATAADEFRTGDNVIQLGGCTGQPVDTIQIISDRGPKLILLVIPPTTEREEARTAMMSAAAAENSSTIEDLLRDLIENGG